MVHVDGPSETISASTLQREHWIVERLRMGYSETRPLFRLTERQGPATLAEKAGGGYQPPEGAAGEVSY